jgi:hypothetical protein
LYGEIAKGLHDRSSIMLLYSLFGVMSGLVVSKIFIKKSRNPKGEAVKKKLWIPYFLAIVALSFIFISIIRIHYVNSAIVHYQQCFEIAGPNLKENEKEKIMSDFRQVDSKQDYVKIIKKLKKVSEKNNQNFPDFYIW